ncbi:hypothetical protein KKB06_02010, partial [Patescibacteria group bacterium]|nr:hypothetical protein [Patescibacteria group bacterium]
MGTASGCDDSNTPVDISLKCGPNEFLVSDGTGVENCFDKQLIDIFCDKNDCSKLTIVAPDIPEEIKLENIVLEPTSTPRPPEAYPEPLKDEEKVHGIQVITFESDVSR